MRRLIWSYTVCIWQTTIDVSSKPRVNVKHAINTGTATKAADVVTLSCKLKWTYVRTPVFRITYTQSDLRATLSANL